MNRSRRTRSSRAFTLAELLIAVAITILIVAFLGRVLVATTAVWQLADQRIDAFRDARSAMQLMTRDLSRANVNGNQEMLRLSVYPTDNSYAKEAYAVFPAKNSGKSDLCTAGYYLDWNSTSKTYSLRRFFKDSNNTAPSLAQTAFDFSTLYDRTKNTTPETIASYVWDLRFTPGESTGPVLLGASGDPSTKWSWVEVRFKAMSVNAGRKIQGITAIDQNAWGDPTASTYKTFILPYEQQFVTRISILQNQ